MSKYTLVKKQEIRERLSLLMASFAFLFSGIDALNPKNLTLAASNFLMVIINILAVYFLKRYPRVIKVLLLLLNSVISFIIAYSYFSVGKKALPYAWLFIAALNLIVAFIIYRKEKPVLNP